MSAFIVSREHVRALVQAGLERRSELGALRWPRADLAVCGGDGADWRVLNDDEADRIGQLLTDACVKSVRYRYSGEPDADLPGCGDAAEPYVHRLRVERRSAVEVLKLIDCYEYQSCEHPEWWAAEARQFCAALRRRMIGELPGYRDAAWEARAAAREVA